MTLNCYRTGKSSQSADPREVRFRRAHDRQAVCIDGVTDDRPKAGNRADERAVLVDKTSRNHMHMAYLGSRAGHGKTGQVLWC
jgi:hypothetical protein